ncbi:C2H2-like zinc finger protein [Quillaja saponaria]|uniref:C2H2-like zinc finger protein n=1 Tax=Quillaja saponaria TaxID=32244 RepID=A0AAD7LYH2_QUISA|nr:C2H2-like zinc finger protein [Quillaja saponaria]KAJ7966590.1 C2H2-like zinc finger protein [Quillaja saponaria]
MSPLSLCDAINVLHLHLYQSSSSIVLQKHKHHSCNLRLSVSSSPSLQFTNTVQLSISTKPPPLRRWQTLACAANPAVSAGTSEIDMVRNKEGIYTPKQKKVVVLWDLDNKPPRGPPYQAAVALKQVAQRFGDVVDMSAYANRHAFIHLPQWVLQERRERKQFNILERKGVVVPSDPYVCGVCGRKCKTNFDLKKHFKQLHERERQKKINRMRSLKGKKRQRYKERFISGNHKYSEAARSLLTPKVGYGLAGELRRAGVFVKTVEDKPQAADWALKRQMQHSMSRGIDWLVLVSDDSDFSDMLRRAKEANLGTVVVGDWDRALGRHADLWVPWTGVEKGELSEENLVPKRKRRRRESSARDDGFFSVTEYEGDIDGVSELDSVLDELVAMRTDFNEVRSSAFSDEEEEEQEWVTSEDEDTDEEDGFY